MLRQRFKAENMPGIIADECGRILGNHSGIHHFTIGQRRGLSIGTGKRCWVKDICHETATVTVTSVLGDLLSRTFAVSGVSWVDGEIPAYPIICSVQVRYRQTAVDSIITLMEDGCLRVSCSAAINSVTPGQAAVFYDLERVLGRGWILDAA
jgi:tRNA-specific 2-thiouridylase